MSFANLTEEERAFVERYKGQQRNGRVYLRDFDEGVVLTLGAELGKGEFASNYFLPPSLFGNVCPPKGLPGIPIVFGNPDDQYEQWQIPMVKVQREDLTPSMQRFHPGLRQYRVPGKGAQRVQSSGFAETTSGWDGYEEQTGAVPYDISYNIMVQARNRGGKAAPAGQGEANSIFHYVISVYQPYCTVRVRDSIGDLRGYDAFVENMGVEDEFLDVGDRMIGFRVSLRVEAELDINLPDEFTAVRSATRTLDQKG